MSARALALTAMATLAVFGCGGSSSDDQDSQTASAPTSRGKQADAGGPASKPSAPRPNPVPASGQGTSATQGKQSPKVVIPSGEREKGITPKQRAEATVQSMALESPALEATSTGGVPGLPAAYTCDGKDTWPELTWRGVPPDTAELALYAMALRPVEGELVYAWTVAGLDPSLTGIPAGQLPQGAVMGRNSSGKAGYTVCPPEGSSETYIFTLYALPERLGAQRGFDPNAMRREIAQTATDGGVMAVGYGRR